MPSTDRRQPDDARERGDRADEHRRGDGEHGRDGARSASPESRTGTVRASESTSAVVRETRSPVPARSTVESGSASTRRMKSSRRRAKIRSARTNDWRRANHVSTVWATTNTASKTAIRSTWRWSCPRSTSSTRPPSRGGPASPATAASACRPSTAASGHAVPPRERAGVARISGPSAIGSVSLMSRPRLSSRVTVPGTRGSCRRSSRCVPAATTRPSWRKTTRSAWSSTSGLARHDDRRPARARLAQPPGDAGLGVGVDRARRLDEHEDLGVGEQRSGQDEALPLAARERAAALLDVARRARRGSDSRTSSAFATATASRMAASSERSQGSSSWRSVPEKSSGSVSLTRSFAGRASTGSSASGTPPRLTPGVVDEPAQPVGERGRVLRAVAETTRGEQARRDDEPRAGVRERHVRRRLGRPAPTDRRPAGSTREHVEHPPRADERPRDLVDGLGGRAEREHEEGGVAVERDELARRDSPVDRETWRRARRRVTTKIPGRSTCAASSVDCGSATRTPARRTCCERLR